MRCGNCVTIAVVAVLMVIHHASYGEDGKGVVAAGAKLQKLGVLYHNTAGRSKTEGPVADHKGNVYFTDPYGAVIYRWNAKDGLGIFTDDSGGANGLFLDAAGTIVACQAYRRRVAAFGSDGTETVLADSYEGKRLNEPNDLYIDSRGGIYFSDPFWHVHNEPSEIDCEGVYYITPGARKVVRVIDDLRKPNGIHSSPDGSVLYVIDTPQDKTFMYDVKPDGTLEHGREFAPHGLDGLTVDSNGNVYITALEEKVYVYTSGGKLIDTIEAPEQPSNVCFGGDDNKTLFITAGKSLYSIRILQNAEYFAAETLEPSLAVRDTSGTILWYDIRLLDVEGRGWNETAEFYDRLPSKAKNTVRKPVWDLSRDSAGMCVRYVTDATMIWARWSLRSESLAMPHMPATGVSGLDLYVKTGSGTWRWIANGRPTVYPTNTVSLVNDIPEGRREYILYLPLYNGVTSVEIGIPDSSSLSKAGPWGPGERKPVVFYGTSITQGGCASRPGMVYTAILGRRLNYPVINLGFSGNGRMEPELARLLAELDPSVYVLDCLPNLTPEETAGRTEPFVRILREKHPVTPIVLAEDRSYTNSFLVTANRIRNEEGRKALRQIYDRLTAAGDENLYCIDGEMQLGDDSEGAVDGSHPNDLGFMRQAEVFYRVLAPILKEGGAR